MYDHICPLSTMRKSSTVQTCRVDSIMSREPIRKLLRLSGNTEWLPKLRMVYRGYSIGG